MKVLVPIFDFTLIHSKIFILFFQPRRNLMNHVENFDEKWTCFLHIVACSMHVLEFQYVLVPNKQNKTSEESPSQHLMLWN